MVRLALCLAGAALSLTLLSATASAGQVSNKPRILMTESGIRFGILGNKPSKPAPTIFVFALSIEETLGNPLYDETGEILAGKGYTVVSLDVPGHGRDVRPGETADSIRAWRARIEHGDNFVDEFVARASTVLGYLVDEGYSDSRRVAASGTSRGAYVALQFAASDPRVAAVVAFIPVTNLLALSEFEDLEGTQSKSGQAALRMARMLALRNVAGKLAGRPIWICIGSNDRRVDTESAIEFSRKLEEVAIAAGKAPAVDLRVTATQGHRVYGKGHEDAATWILMQLQIPPE